MIVDTMTMTAVTAAEIEFFRCALADMMKGFYAAHFPANPVPTVEIMTGKRYARIVRVSPGERSAYGFIDLISGDLLKSDGWKSPAKGKRGSIKSETPLAGCGPYGMAYLR
jgi:hypothetical protein